MCVLAYIVWSKRKGKPIGDTAPPNNYETITPVTFAYAQTDKPNARTDKTKDYNDTAADATPKAPIECRVYNRTTRGVTYQKISVDAILKVRETYGGLGRRWLREGKEVFALVKLNEFEYAPAIPPKEMKELPSYLHRKLTDTGAVKVFFDMKIQQGFLQKNGWLIGLGIGVIAVIFIAVTGK